MGVQKTNRDVGHLFFFRTITSTMFHVDGDVMFVNSFLECPDNESCPGFL